MGLWIVGILAGLVVFDLLVHLAFALFAVRIFERKIPFTVTGHPPVPEAERIAFPTTGSLTLRGALYRQPVRPSRGTIVFCPELEGNHWSALSYCRGLWENGYDIRAFDFRNQGEGDHFPGYAPLRSGMRGIDATWRGTGRWGWSVSVAAEAPPWPPRRSVPTFARSPAKEPFPPER